MKNTLLFTALLSIGTFTAFAQPNPPDTPNKVQVGILFDTSNSMDGLIDQAKSRIWNIVNEVSQLTYNGQNPEIEFALYQYGNDGLSKTSNYIEQVLALTSDLDLVSQKLFGLRTNGGSEYCGAVIHQSLEDLSWSSNPSDLKMIYIAGNESFKQGPIDYKVECKKAAIKGVFINTIFCGNYDEGVRLFWKEGANCSTGDYFNIDSNKDVVHIDTPYDTAIKQYNDSLNGTYHGYGVRGIEKKSMQVSEDANAAYMASDIATERSVAKSKKVYNNASWDMVDAVAGGKDISEMEEQYLPEEFKGKTEEERKELIEEMTEDRKRFQEKIAELASKREEFIQDEMKKRADAGEELDDFGSSVNEGIMKKAVDLGYNK